MYKIKHREKEKKIQKREEYSVYTEENCVKMKEE